MSKRLEIQIAPDDLEFLKSNQYLLCFARLIQGNNANIVWQCFSDYLQNNPFGWLPQYEVFGTSSFIVGGVATIDTAAVTIAPAQQTTLNEDAVFGSPVPSVPPESIRVNNSYRQQIYLGLGATSIGPDGVQRTTPVYVTPTPFPMNWSYTMTPTDIVQVWFQQDIVTSTIIGPDIPNAMQISLPATRNFGKLRYQAGKWSEQVGDWSNTL
jgi:hypothetical protein